MMYCLPLLVGRRTSHVRRNSVLLLVLALTLSSVALTAAPRPAAAVALAVWQPPASLGLAEAGQSVAIDGDGWPVVAWVRRSGGGHALVVSRQDSAGWATQVVDDFAATGVRALNPHLAIDRFGRLHLSYHDAAAGSLRYAVLEGATWRRELVDASQRAGQANDIAVDLDGRPHLVYHDPASRLLKYAHPLGSQWLIEVIDPTPGAGEECAVAADARGDLHVAYSHRPSATSGQLRYARRDAGGWHLEVPDAGGPQVIVGRQPAIVVDGEYRPRIAHFGQDGQIKLARMVGVNWIIETALTISGAGQLSGMSAALDPTGRLQMALLSPSAVYYTRHAPGGTWETSIIVAGTTSVGGAASLALDPVGRPYVGYTQPSGTGHAAFCITPPAPAFPGLVPAAPSAVVVTPTSLSSVRVTWSDNSADESGFAVERRAGTSGEWLLIAEVGPGVTTIEDHGLEAGTHWYRVRAHRVAAERARYSAYSPPIAITIAPSLVPAMPAELQAAVTGTGEITLTWSNPSAGVESGFQVERRAGAGAWTRIATLPAGASSYKDTGVAVGLYAYRVRSHAARFGMAWHSPYSMPVTVNYTGLAEPAAPSGLCVTVRSGTALQLDWYDNSTNESGFRIERRAAAAGSAWSQVASVAAGVTTYLDSGLASGASYVYRVRAYRTAGSATYNSVYSEEATGTPGALTGPVAPSLLTVAAAGTAVELAWRDNSGNETGFRVERRPASGAAAWETVADLAADTRFYLDQAALVAGAPYQYRVLAYRVVPPYSHDSAYSNAVVAIPYAVAVPETPGRVDVAAISPYELRVSWGDNSEAEDGFEIYRRVDGVWTLVGSVGQDITAIIDGPLTPGMSQTYAVRSFAQYGSVRYYSAYTVPQSGMTMPRQVPVAPHPVSATGISPGEVTINWMPLSATGGARIQRKGPGGAYLDVAAPTGGTVTSYGDRGLAPSTTYTYRVQTWYEQGGVRLYSPWSAVATATTPGPAAVATPTTLAAAAEADGGVRLTWVEKALWEIGFNIERRAGSGPWVLITTTAPETIEYIDTTADGGTQYTYRVRAVTAHAQSEWSNTATVTTPGTPSKIVVRIYVNRTDFYVNNVRHQLDAAPINLHSRVMLPIRAVVEALGGNVTWDAAEQKVTAVLANNTVEVWVGNNRGRVNGQWQQIDADNPLVKPVIVPPGRTMLPVRFITTNLGCDILWNGTLQEVKITYPR